MHVYGVERIVDEVLAVGTIGTLLIRFTMNSIFSPYNSAKMIFSREMSSYAAMADSKVHSDDGIVFYALEI